jgi:disulfide bond formation protein DsbB
MDQALPIRQTGFGSWLGRLRAEPALAAPVAIFVISFATLAGAWFFEYVLKYLPCPLCLEQRLPYHVVIPLSLLVAIAAYVRAPQKLIAAGLIVILIAVLCGAALGAYHAGVEWGFWEGPTDCSMPLTDLRTGGSIAKQVQSVHVVLCTVAAWRFLGISLAGYNCLISLGMAAIAAWGLLSRRSAA